MMLSKMTVDRCIIVVISDCCYNNRIKLFVPMHIINSISIMVIGTSFVVLTVLHLE